MWAYRFGDPHSGHRCKAMPVGKLFKAQKMAPNNSNPIAATPLAGVVIPDNGKGAENAPIDAPVAAGDDASTPAMAPVGDVMPRNLSAACDLRAAFAHHKDNCHG
jgi:hypothetical protein